MTETNTKDCPQFEKCDAMLCPLDPDIEKRVWFADEPVCSSHKHGRHRWIRKQRSIRKRKTKSWNGKPISYRELYDASRPRKLTDERRRELAERMAGLRVKISA